ncbi:unnamed protein product [Dibothriocephalus latus]|uniref:Uncharacterized protein n=1 Tax=Dibothriocephalus latus TaxID=60516 RepID=A0A3P7LPG0_DIBLA|nr:unnamed protein product [Dibothriocephalus latus]
MITKKSARGRVFKKPPQTARQAIIVALSECNDIIQSSRVFPIKKGQPFPSDLPSESAKICKKLLFCLSHLYMSHFRHLEQLDLIAHVNTLAKHFFAFTTRFNLIEDCNLGPLNGFHRSLLACPAPILNQKGGSSMTADQSVRFKSGSAVQYSFPNQLESVGVEPCREY